MNSTRLFAQDESFKIQEKNQDQSGIQRNKKRSGTSSNVITRGMELVRKKKWSNEDDERLYHRRLSQPNMDYGFIQLKTSWSTQNTPRTSIEVIDNKNMMPSIQETESTHLYNRALHTPTRYLPQNQAIITTNSDGVILLFNDIASICFEEPFKSQITSILKRKKEKMYDNMQKVIVCGATTPIHKRNEVKSIASLWLKEKITENGDKVYIWIFEEIYETTLSVYVDSDCKIQRVLGTMIEIYGYKEDDIIGKPVNCLVPALSKEQRDDNLEKIDRLKFFGSLSSQGVYFPVILSLNRHVAIGNDDLATFVVKITSLPSISGSITFHRSTGLIQHLNTVPAKYLFGYSVNMVINKLNINELMPQIPIILSKMGNIRTANSRLCKKILSKDDDDDEQEEYIYVHHRDKSKFAVEIEIKLIEEDDLVNVWITYDRIDTVSKHEKSKNHLHHHMRELSLQNKKKEQDAPTTETKKRRPIVRPYRISSFGAVDEAKRLFPSNYLSESNQKLSQTMNNTEKKKHPLDDYVILDVLGQGTYVTSMEDEDCYFVVMELLGGGMDLFDYIELNKNMTENEVRHIFYQIANAVKHLHTHKIVHRDIKDENVVLDNEGTVHLIDFGCATYYKKGRKFDTFTGTLEYCAPEVLKGKPYEGPPQDIWASGVLLFTLIYRENPFYNIDEILESELRVPFVLSEGSLDLVKKMLNREVEKRIDIDQVLAHPWFYPISQQQQL
ncbi:hypothetical protein G6F62_003506 [Rhizopus arrhizus]|nr:hypothetical protein G6F62_003506 [Rhizopus arrhizus]